MSQAQNVRLGAALEGRYTVIREIGRGGMATVFLARDLKHDRDVALKVLHRELGVALGAERFLAEIRTTAQLHHPNILPLFDSGEADGIVFYVMPYVEGENLRDRIAREGQLGVTDSVRIVQAVADALDHAHQHGVIHRDIKPENILLQDGHALVADFGIAIAVSSAGGQRITQTGFSVGTPHYMSPEQAAAERQIDGKSDQYSLAAVLYEMLTGEPPFTGPSAAAVTARMMSEAPADVARRRPSVPDAVATAVHRALAKVPGDRFASVAAFGAALAPPVRATGDHLAATIASARPRPWWRDLRSVTAIGGVALAIGAFALRSGTGGSPMAEPRHWSIALEDSLPMSTSHDQYGTATRSLDLSPDGRTLLYTSPGAGTSRIVAVDLVTGTSRVVPSTAGARSPAFSPDGRAFAAVVGDSEVRRYSLADGSFLRLAGDPEQTLAWPFDDRIFGDGGCVVIPATGGASDAVRSRAACNGTWDASDVGAIANQAHWLLLSLLNHIEAVTPAGAVRTMTADTGAPLHGDAPRYVAPGFVVYTNGNTLQAARFNPRTVRLTSVPAAVLGGVRHEQSGTTQYAISGDGTLVWASGADGALARFVWVDRSGRMLDTLRFIPPTEVGSFALSDDGRRLAYSAVASDGSSALIVADLSRQVIDRIPSADRLDPVAWLDRGSALSAVLTRPDGSTRGARIRRAADRWMIDTTVAGYAVQSVDASVTCRMAVFGSTERMPTLVWRAVAPFDSMVIQSDSGDAGGGCILSPDGRRVLLATSGGWSVAPIAADGLAHRVRVFEGSAEPRWSPDGREILYRRATEWYAVRAPGPDMQPSGAPQLLFRGNFLQAFADWDRGPDGRFLLLAGQTAANTTHLNVITHFDRYLAERLKAGR